MVFKEAFNGAMQIFEITKNFPQEEKYSLIDQIRRSSRSICANIAEAYRKRIYPNHFKSKISDADSECSETMVWLDFAYKCNYIDSVTYNQLMLNYISIGKMIGSILNDPGRFIPRN